MLDQELLAQISEYMKILKVPITIRLNQMKHEKREELLNMLEQIKNTSELIKIEIGDYQYRSGVSFEIISENGNGVIFSGVPGGHEFNSFILAVLQIGGHQIKLDESLQKIIKNIDHELNFETIVSLSCHNCPEVVQALNQMAILNPKIKNEMIDGGLFPELIAERKIQGVPAIYLNDEIFANGKMEISEIIEKIKEIYQIENNKTIDNEIYDMTIIGGGPAGVSAAIYAARKGLKVMMLADRIGGQVKDTMDIENLISIKKTNGPQLTNAMEEHLQQYNVKIRKNLKVKQVTVEKEIILNTDEMIKSKSIIVATGAKWRQLNVPGEKENIGNGVAYCPHCDGPFFAGKDVIVVGGGNSGIEAALDLSKIVKSVTVFEFLPVLKADHVLVEMAKKSDNINIITEAMIKEIKTKDDKVSDVIYLDRKTSEEKEFKTDGIFIQIGLIPNSDFIKDTVETTKFGEIVINDRCETNIKGIFACGDVTTTPYKQIIIAMGEGAKAAISASNYLTIEN